jgi:peptide/nickel transport system permease protein
MSRFVRQVKWKLVLPFLILGIFVITAIFANVIAPYNPLEIDLAHSSLPPTWQFGGNGAHPLGTDELGRDILSRLIYGARTSLIVASLSVFGAGVVGTTLGIFAGYKGGWFDTIISRAIDLVLGFPMLLVAMVLAIVLGASLFNVVIIVVVMYWAGYARQARAETLQIRELNYVILARTAGCSELTIMFRHVLPNVFNTVIVIATLGIGSVILLESGLSFLGAGIPPPNPSWGSMCAEGRGFIASAWWISFMPGVAIMAVVLSANLLGDWLRDKLDPRLRAL